MGQEGQFSLKVSTAVNNPAMMLAFLSFGQTIGFIFPFFHDFLRKISNIF